jgi:hypothetical protein
VAWIWLDPSEDEVRVWAEYDHTNSTFDSSDVLTDKPLPSSAGKAILRVSRFKMARVRQLRCLPTTCSAPVVTQELADVLSKHVKEGEVQFYPVLVKTSDDVTGDYSFVIPLKSVSCTDLDKSVITDWIIPGLSAYGYEKIVHKPKCIGDHAIARDQLFRHIVVSDKLREDLLSTGDKGLAFLEPEAMRDLYTQMRDRANHPGKSRLN